MHHTLTIGCVASGSDPVLCWAAGPYGDILTRTSQRLKCEPCTHQRTYVLTHGYPNYLYHSPLQQLSLLLISLSYAMQGDSDKRVIVGGMSIAANVAPLIGTFGILSPGKAPAAVKKQ